MTRLKAPEGVSSAAVEDTQYEVDGNGHIEVDNPEHIPHLQRHGFDYADEAEITHSEDEDEVGPEPDFSKFVNRQALVDYLVAHGNSDHEASEKRSDLEDACRAQYALLAAGEAQRLHPEAGEETEVEQEEQGIVDEADLEDAAK